MAEVNSLAVFVDFENLALGLQNRRDRFDIQLVLQRLVEKGKIIVKKGYADWSRYSDYKRELHEAGLELIEIPRRAMTGKNSADIHLVVDAMDLCYSKEHINAFVIVSGDSDFSPLVSKLKENGKRVIGLAMRNSTSELLVNACDEFIFYEDVEEIETPQGTVLGVDVPKEKQIVFGLLLDTLIALRREVDGPYYASMIKDTIRRKQPSFFESTYGYSSFSSLLEDAEQAGLVELKTDSRSGTYVVSGFKAPQRRSRRGRRKSTRTTSTSSSEARTKKSTGDTERPASERPRRPRRSTSTASKTSRRSTTSKATSGSKSSSRTQRKRAMSRYNRGPERARPRDETS